MLQVGPVERDELPELRLVEEPLDLVDLAWAHREPLDQPLAHVARRRGRHLEPHHVAEAPAPQLGLDGLEEVVGVVGQLEVGVLGDAEQRPPAISIPGKSTGRKWEMTDSSGTSRLPIVTNRSRTSGP